MFDTPFDRYHDEAAAERREQEQFDEREQDGGYDPAEVTARQPNSRLMRVWIGVLIVLAPRVTAFGGDTIRTMEAVGAIIVLLGATCGALAQIYIRKMVATEQVSAIVFWFTCTSIVMSLMTLPYAII